MLLRIFFAVQESFPHLTRKNQKYLYVYSTLKFLFLSADIIQCSQGIVINEDHANLHWILWL
jgi:hypothetical protein